MAVYSIRTIQKIPVSLQVTWDFFSSPANLQRITPANIGLETISKHHGEKIHPGQIIEYKIKPLLGISLYWMTEITQVRGKEFFIDEQKKGPYSLWHHQHHFKAIDGGTEMTDIVHYKNPLWFLGDMANVLFVKKQLKEIFNFRFRKIEEIFGKWENQPLHAEIH